MRRLSRLDGYVTAVTATGGAVLAWLVWTASLSATDVHVEEVAVLGLVLLFGELRPIRISHGDGSVDEVTVSSSFSLALVLLGPLVAAVLAQLVATLVDDVRRGKDPRRVAFNVAQYTVTLTVSRLVYALASHRGVLGGGRVLGPMDIVAALLAAGAFFLVNHAITTTAVALSLGDSPWRRLPVDARYHLSTSGVLLAMAPVLVVAVHFSPLVLPLLVMPITAVHRSASLAIQRETESLHDALTGLPNRVLLRQRTDSQLAPAEDAGPAQPLAMMLVDLDHFKEINDTLGHHVGDRVIQETAARLSAAMLPGATVARLGGDEFAVLVATGADRALGLAEDLLAAVTPPILVDGVRLEIGASVGVALAPRHGTDTDTLLRRADVALYAAKEDRNAVRVYQPELDPHSVERLGLLGELRRGVSLGEITVYYQPKCDALTGQVVSVEALARWMHPQRGLVSPEVFVPIAENTGVIVPLTEVVLDQALAQLRVWRRELPELTVAVNISARQLTDRDLPVLVAGALRRADLPAAALTLEVTETSVLGTSARVDTVLADLRRIGVRLAIDDFGSGFTSLSYLSRLNMDELKIDKSFVLGLDSDRNAAIVRSTIELGHNLGLTVVAEGVETAEAWSQLVVLGCDFVQGYQLSRPLPPAELLPLLRRSAPVGRLPAPRVGLAAPTGRPLREELLVPVSRPLRPAPGTAGAGDARTA